MKKFTCQCLDSQFKKSEEVYVDYDEQVDAEISCIYRPNDKVNFRKIKLKANYCPQCGAKLQEFKTKP